MLTSLSGCVVVLLAEVVLELVVEELMVVLVFKLPELAGASGEGEGFGTALAAAAAHPVNFGFWVATDISKVLSSIIFDSRALTIHKQGTNRLKASK